MKILIIDDEPNILLLVKNRLEANTYEVITAKDGEEGLKKVLDEKPDLVIVDVMMPKLNGYDFVKKVKYNRETENIPIIVLSAQGKLKDLFDIEGLDFIDKPFDPEELLGKVKKHLLGKKE